MNPDSDRILRLSYTYLKRTADAQDIRQTVFLKLFTNPRRFDRPERHFMISGTDQKGPARLGRSFALF